MWGVPGTYPIPTAQQWSLNPAAYKNIPYDQVDWATLAQQWIRMKESVPPMPPPITPPMMEAPPAPRINTSFDNVRSSQVVPLKGKESKDIEEGGEAPMEMDTKDDEVPIGHSAPQGNTWNQWNNWQSQWGWGWSPDTGTVPMAPTGPTTVDCKVKTQNTDSSFPVFNNYVAGVSNFPVAGNDSGISKISPTTGAIDFTAEGGGNFPPPRSQNYGIIPPCVSSPRQLNTWSRGSSKSIIGKQDLSPVHSTSTISLDSIRKKQLPAWIRDGLSKMEKEKQRKLKQDAVMIEHDNTTTIAATATDDSIYGMRSDSVLSNISSHNQQANDKTTELVFAAADSETAVIPILLKRKSRFDDTNVKEQSEQPAFITKEAANTATTFGTVEQQSERTQQQQSMMTSSSLIYSPPSRIRKTKDQLLTETMLKVRRILTEILLDVTNEQVQSLVKEEYTKVKSSGVVLQQRKSQSLSMLGSSLGLTQYGSDSSDSDGENDNSDEELKVLIEKKKKAFKQTEEEIEKEIELQEEQERLIMEKENEFSRREYETDSDNDDDDENDDSENEIDDHRLIESRTNENSDKTSNVNTAHETIVRQSSVSSLKSSTAHHGTQQLFVTGNDKRTATDKASMKNNNTAKSERHSYDNNDHVMVANSNRSKIDDTVTDNDVVKKTIHKYGEMPSAPPAPMISNVRKSIASTPIEPTSVGNVPTIETKVVISRKSNIKKVDQSSTSSNDDNNNDGDESSESDDNKRSKNQSSSENGNTTSPASSKSSTSSSGESSPADSSSSSSSPTSSASYSDTTSTSDSSLHRGGHRHRAKKQQRKSKEYDEKHKKGRSKRSPSPRKLSRSTIVKRRKSSTSSDKSIDRHRHIPSSKTSNKQSQKSVNSGNRDRQLRKQREREKSLSSSSSRRRRSPRTRSGGHRRRVTRTRSRSRSGGDKRYSSYRRQENRHHHGTIRRSRSSDRDKRRKSKNTR